MKIIGIAGRDKYILEANDYELGRITGRYSSIDLRPEVGMEIEVSELYQATREIVDGAKELTDQSEKVAKLLSALQKFGATIGPVVAKIKEKSK